jgi:hypothetical protein
MAYRFNFDLTRVSQSFFREIAKTAENTDLHRKISQGVLSIIDKFKIHELTGLDIQNIVEVVTDLVDIQIKNVVNRQEFDKGKKRVLFLPQCLREKTHGSCRATFKPEIPSHFCNSCSSNCLVNQATFMGKQKGYDVYIIDGGSCIASIIEKNSYDAVIGVACSPEIKLGGCYLEQLNIPCQGVPLTKNGCVFTKFNIESLRRII